MGYDIWLEGGSIDVPGHYTYNVDPMFMLALDGDASLMVTTGGPGCRKPKALERFVGKPARDAVQPLTEAVERMEADPDAYRALNPPNGWGDYEGALDYLRRFLHECRRCPDVLVEAWL